MSVIIPAYNEESFIHGAITSVQASFAELAPDDFEIIVSDDASTDRTALLAEQAGAMVVYSGKRNIGATRNIGAQSATGEWLVFFDADSVLNPGTIKEMLESIKQDFIGGGTPITWDQKVPFPARLCTQMWNLVSRLFRLPAGSFFFVKKEWFDRVGGFNEEYFVSEELHLARELKKYGQLTILRTPIQTSARKVFDYPMSKMVKFMLMSLFSPIKTAKNKDKLDMWYQHR